jgi:hypothetical protein
MDKKTAIAITGGLSQTTKMPCESYNLPASACKVGSKLAQIEGTVCHGCYARKGNYNWDNVQKALHRRLDSLDCPQWVEAMVFLIGAAPHFRWHDSGDLQGIEHLKKIIEVCEQTPGTQHWLPTLESEVLTAFINSGRKLPANLTVRYSTPNIDSVPSTRLFARSMVYSGDVPAGVRACPATLDRNSCDTCRDCWDRSIAIIGYKKH